MTNKKRILLIGVSSGLGYRVAELLMNDDCIVYAAAPDIKPMRPLEAMGAKLIAMDVTNSESVQQGVDSVIEAQGGIDCVLFNAGLHVSGTVESVSEELSEKAFQINVMGAARVIRAVTPRFRKQRSGRILFTASVVSHISIMMSGWYAATKHALHALVTAYRQEVSRFGIEAVLIEPGQIDTGFEDHSIKQLLKIDHAEDYQPLVKQYIGLTTEFLGKSPNAEGTAEIMRQAILKPKPKTHYRTTRDAKLLPIVSFFLSTKLMDKFFVREFGKREKKGAAYLAKQ